jgi:hypothetical protein
LGGGRERLHGVWFSFFEWSREEEYSTAGWSVEDWEERKAKRGGERFNTEDTEVAQRSRRRGAREAGMGASATFGIEECKAEEGRRKI